MKNIKIRLVVNFVFIIIITVVVLEMFLLSIVKQNHYKNLEDNLSNQVKVSTELYARYFSDTSLHENVLNNVDTFWKQTSAQVQIIDASGNILMDSIGILPGNISEQEDVKRALQGHKGKWIGKVDYDTEKVLSVAYPLYSQGEIVGVLRFITSLKEVDKDIERIAFVFIVFGGIVMILSGFVSIFLANTIVGPLKEVTTAAERMAKGDFRAESRKRMDDEIGRLSDTLNYMASEILKKEQLKNDFISSVSHELRTPLTSIKGWAITLKHGYEDREMLIDGLDIIEKESDRLTTMVEELLDFSKFVSGKITLEKRTIQIQEIMEHIKKQLMPRAMRDHIEFVVIYPERLPVLYGDSNRLKQVFINILDNAFKFTPGEGKIVFTVECEGENLIFRITDTGCGISEEELPKVKEKFYKGKSSKSKNGIGLSICDELVRMMNGKLDISSQINGGTVVTVLLPLQERD